MDTTPIGTIIVQSTRQDAAMIAQGYLPMMDDGITYSKTLYAVLWSMIQDTEWVAQDMGAGFRLRNMSNHFVRGNGTLTEPPGLIQEDAAPNIRGHTRIGGGAGFGIIDTPGGAFSVGTGPAGPTLQQNPSQQREERLLVFNASTAHPNSKYRDGITEIRPTNVSAFYYIKATSGFVPDNPTDLQATLTELQQFTSNTLVELQQLKDEMNDIIGPNTDYVVESWAAPGGTIWYRKYKSGWAVQGFRTWQNSNSIITTLPIPMADAGYCVQATPIWMDNSPTAMAVRIGTRTRTTVQTGVSNLNGTNAFAPGITHCVEVSGMAAQ